MRVYKTRREETLFELLLFPDQLVRSEEHAVRLEELMEGAKHSLFIAMYVLSHERLAIAIKETGRRGVSVTLLVDHTQMYCKRSRVAKIMLDDDDSKRRVNVYCDKVPSYMLHHNGGVIIIHDDQRMVSPLLKDFARVLDTDSFRPVTKSKLLEKTQPCEQCQLAERLSVNERLPVNERQPTDECVTVDLAECSNPEAVLKRFFAMMTVDQQAVLLAKIKQDTVCAPAPINALAVSPPVKRAAASKKQARRAKRATPLVPKKQ